MQAALEILGYRCYHMREVPRQPGHLDAWHDRVTAGVPVDWQQLFRGFDATVDAPACFYYKELAAAFPEAKVIHTIRPADRWYDSFAALLSTIESFGHLRRIIPRARKAYRFVTTMHAQAFKDPFDRQVCIAAYDAHNAAVQRDIPADRLLVFDVRQGWEPLCTFLNREVPAGIKFPHLNEGQQTVRALIARSFVGPFMRQLLVIGGVGALAFIALRRLNRRRKNQ